jgi:hypothetical protein
MITSVQQQFREGSRALESFSDNASSEASSPLIMTGFVSRFEPPALEEPGASCPFWYRQVVSFVGAGARFLPRVQSCFGPGQSVF